MVPADFEYHTPATLAEVHDLLARYGDDARLLAGGHSLLPLMKLRLAQPAHLIDLSRVPGLSGIRVDGATLVIGPLTTHQQVHASADVQRLAPALAEAAGLIGDPLVRNRGTIGGSLCHADPGADLPAVMLALEAQMVATAKGGNRTIAAADFFVDSYESALQAGEVLTEVRVPAAVSAYVKFPSPASRYAVVGVAARLTLANGNVSAVGVALTGAGSKATRLSGVERALAGSAANAAAFQQAASHAAEGWEPLADIHASAAFRQHLAKLYTHRALEAAAARA